MSVTRSDAEKYEYLPGGSPTVRNIDVLLIDLTLNGNF